MQKVVLINPPLLYSRPEPIHPPLGLAYIAAVLEREGFIVSLIDAPIVQMPTDEVLVETKKEKPDIVGITCVAQTYSGTLRLAESIKRDLGVPVVLGGPHVTFDFRNALSSEAVDYVIRYEGEYPMLDLVSSLTYGKDLCNVKSLVYKKDGVMCENSLREILKDLDELPFPARHLLPMKEYARNHPYGFMFSSRGCPYRCTFCSSAIRGHFWRGRKAKCVVDEVEEIVEKYGFRKIYFADAIFTLKRQHVENICNEFLTRKIDVDWACETRADAVDEDLLMKMKKAGCGMIALGVESGNQVVLDRAKKSLTVEKTRRAFEVAKKLEIKTTATVILGLPGETKQSAAETIHFVKVDLKPDVVFFQPPVPYPGAELYEAPEKLGIRVLDTSWYMSEKRIQQHHIVPLIESDTLNANDLLTLLIEAYATFHPRLKVTQEQPSIEHPILSHFVMSNARKGEKVETDK